MKKLLIILTTILIVFVLSSLSFYWLSSSQVAP